MEPEDAFGSEQFASVVSDKEESEQRNYQNVYVLAV